ncbi:MAG: CDP-alcohol phosphatidyltransferase family protein [Chloroflexi bacterium]|nr:CDP-alcohol phosphatidyltransferase family protein [Chloroflexota bacterium]
MAHLVLDGRNKMLAWAMGVAGMSSPVGGGPAAEPALQRVRTAARSALSRYFEKPGAAALASVGISPNMATLLGLVLSGVAAYFAATGRFQLAALFVFVGAVFDLLDGAIARRAGLVSKRGAFLDSTADRVGEGVILLGLLVHFVQPHAASRTGAILAFVAFAGSVMVSYIRARAEGLALGGTTRFEGFFTRAERIAVVVVGLALGQPLITLWILAIGTPLSALQRFLSIWRAARDS